MADRERERERERDLVLPPNEFAFVLDRTKGIVSVQVGPSKTSLSDTDQLVKFSYETKRFDPCEFIDAAQKFCTAPEGWYVVLKNPDKNNSHPKGGTSNAPSEDTLAIGRKINISGPVSFPLWPGQMARVIQGHRLRSNRYLVVRVYDDEAAKASWTEAIIKPQTQATPHSKGTDDSVIKARSSRVPDLTMGKLLVIKGTDVSFYIPPTGVEVVREGDLTSTYVRDAASLERLEYCILLDEGGDKRFVRGPDVVFPNPTEHFVEMNNERKFRALELNPQMGIYLKVIADYTDGEKTYKAGEELFITGEETKIYFPRPEHAIIKYGNKDVHYATAIPDGEARYVLDKNKGTVELIRGPLMFLPDPRRQVVVQRILDPKTVELLYPGNEEALQYNQNIAGIHRSAVQKTGVALSKRARRGLSLDAASPYAASYAVAASGGIGDSALDANIMGAAEDFERKETFTPPRTITLDTKYHGAITIMPWTGYAVQVVSKTGERRVEMGPKTILLAYNENLEKISLSTGKPKTTDCLKDTVYLRVKHNKVSDIVEVETKDLVEVAIKLSYRVDFEGEPEQWFSVENYVKFLCDHLRSKLKNAAKQIGIEAFNNDAIGIVRNTILGVPDEKGQRSGCPFTENGMRVYDVEVLAIQIGDSEIAELLVHTQHHTVQQTLEIAQKERTLDITKRSTQIDKETAALMSSVTKTELELQGEEIEQRFRKTILLISNAVQEEQEKLQGTLDQQKALDEITDAKMARYDVEKSHELVIAQKRLDQRLTGITAEAKCWVDKANAIQPGLIAALQASADKDLMGKLSENMSPLAILGGTSLADVVNQMLKGTRLGDVLASTNDQPLLEESAVSIERPVV